MRVAKHYQQTPRPEYPLPYLQRTKKAYFDILNHIKIDTYPGFKNACWYVGTDGDRKYLQLMFEVPGGDGWQRGRKWWLSPHMTKSEVVMTAMKAYLAAVEHEAREAFRYKGALIYGPHIDVDALAEFVRSKDNLDMRTGAWVTEGDRAVEGSHA